MRRLLIANRGEIALRIMRTAHAMGIATVAVYSDPDAAAPHVQAADEAVRLPGASPAETYLRGDRIIAAALATRTDAIHPGYGFLSENAGFAADVAAAGLTFVGPGPEAIAAMGSKLRAKELMDRAGVPVLPGGEIPASAPPAVLAEIAGRAGFPLLIKASAGGGGRGMRLVRDEAELAGAVEAASREAAAAFGDGTVFAERFVTDPRHIEVQIVGDTYGNAQHIFERECSIQRRYQKIIEESPSPAVDNALRAQLGEAAVRAARAIGYVGAGTVEFVLDRAGRFYFLEVNTRLQVEHPVTELVTGLDLVEIQLRVAGGEPLPAEVRSARLTGHAIEARLYAEDVAAGFAPATGTLHRFEIPGGPGIRVDAGYSTGDVVSPHYDAMLAKVIGYGRTRTEAARRLERALRQARVHGVTTNLSLLAAILAEPEFLAGQTDTGYLTRHDPAAMAAPDESVAAAHALAAALARQAANRAAAPVLATLPSGWRNVSSVRHTAEYHTGTADLTVAYRVDGPQVRATVNGEAPGEHVVMLACTPDAVDLEIDGIRRRYRVDRVPGDRVYVDGPGTSVALTELTRLADPAAAVQAGSLLAPMPAMVITVAATDGGAVTAGQPLIVLEAMKMQHTVLAPADGVIAAVRVKEGDQVTTGQVLAVMAEMEQPDAG
ncbi:MAG: biotin carboxylase N-terminal domain-containing protein [Streptosporangiaceae bacterium]